MIKQGNQYMNLWPEEPVLNAAFPEIRYRKFMLMLNKLVPPTIALLIVWLYFTCGGWDGLYILFTRPSTVSIYLYMSVVSLVAVILALILFPFQIIWWFALRAQTKLDAKQKDFYQKLMQKLEHTPEMDPCLMDLATALNKACKKFKDKDFLNQI